MIHDHALMIRYEKCNQLVHRLYRYVKVLYYKQRRLLHVSATYCGHLYGGVLEDLFIDIY
jgi:hypothetical protein